VRKRESAEFTAMRRELADMKKQKNQLNQFKGNGGKYQAGPHQHLVGGEDKEDQGGMIGGRY
jgi:hypothetical protein